MFALQRQMHFIESFPHRSHEIRCRFPAFIPQLIKIRAEWAKRMGNLNGYEGIDEHCWKQSQTGDTESTGSNERQQKYSKAGSAPQSTLDQSKNSRLNYKACSRSTIVRRAECPNHNTRPFASNKTLNGTNRTPYALNVFPASSKATAKA